MSMMNETLNVPTQTAKDLRVYTKPQLVQYGRVEEITKGGSGSMPESGSMYTLP
jgi:hypothetical protein